MGILQIYTDTAGQINVNPRRVKIISSDNLAKVTSAGYLNQVSLEGYVIYNTDIIDMWYGAVGTNQFISSPGTLGEFTATISNGVITLVQNVSPGNVLLPVVSGDVAVFNGTTGQIKDSGVAFSNGTDTVASLFHGTATAGDFVTINNANKTIQDSGAAPSAASQPFVVMSPGSVTTNHIAQFSDVNGTLKDGGVLGTAAAKAASDNTKSTLASTAGSGFTAGHIVSASDTAGTIQDSGVVAANVLSASFASPDAASDLVWIDVPLPAASLASGGSVTIQASSGSKQYKVRNILMNYSASGLSGGGGDRLVQVTDGTTVYNNAGITAALLGTPVNTVWGGSGNPLPGTVAMNTSTVAGAALVAKYAGGTTDYTTGTVTISVLVQRVA